MRVIKYVLNLMWGKNIQCFMCSLNLGAVASFLLGSKLSFLEFWIKKKTKTVAETAGRIEKIGTMRGKRQLLSPD